MLLPTRRRSATSGIRSSERAGPLDREPGLGAKGLPPCVSREPSRLTEITMGKPGTNGNKRAII